MLDVHLKVLCPFEQGMNGLLDGWWSLPLQQKLYPMQYHWKREEGWGGWMGIRPKLASAPTQDIIMQSFNEYKMSVDICFFSCWLNLWHHLMWPYYRTPPFTPPSCRFVFKVVVSCHFSSQFMYECLLASLTLLSSIHKLSLFVTNKGLISCLPLLSSPLVFTDSFYLFLHRTVCLSGLWLLSAVIAQILSLSVCVCVCVRVFLYIES